VPYIEDVEEFELENSWDVEITDDNKIWRYVPFEKFLSLINSGEIHFRQAELLSDDYEGEIPPKEVIDDPRISELYETNALITHISSWYQGDSESQEMWDEYDDSDFLIKSNYQYLKEALSPDEEYGVQFVEVEYINWTEEELDLISYRDGSMSGNILDPFKYKREQYTFESEFRAIATSIGALSDAEENRGEVNFAAMVEEYSEPNIFVETDLGTLIEEIRVSPGLEGWVVEEVREWIDRELGIGDRVRHSTLAD